MLHPWRETKKYILGPSTDYTMEERKFMRLHGSFQQNDPLGQKLKLRGTITLINERN